MFSKKDTRNISKKTITVIAEGVIVEGKINTKGSARIDGTFRGNIVCGKEIVIGKQGKVKASIKTVDAVIAGKVQGDIVAKGEIEITSTGQIVGNITQKDALLTISKGGLFKGENIISKDNETFKLHENVKKDTAPSSLSNIAAKYK